MEKQATNGPRPPAHLSAPMRRWFAEVVSAFEFEPHHLRLLEAAGGAWDRAEQARKILTEDGLVVDDRFGQKKAHPMVAVERDSKDLFRRLVRELGLDVNSPNETRGPRLGGQRH